MLYSSPQVLLPVSVRAWIMVVSPEALATAFKLSGKTAQTAEKLAAKWRVKKWLPVLQSVRPALRLRLGSPHRAPAPLLNVRQESVAIAKTPALSPRT
jgi:hypothetical protein